MKITVKFEGKEKVIATLQGVPSSIINVIDKKMPEMVSNTFDYEIKRRLGGMEGKPVDRTGELSRSFDLTKLDKGHWRYGQIPGTNVPHNDPQGRSIGVLQEYGFWHVLAKRWVQYPFFIPSINSALEPFGYEITNVINNEITKINKKK